MRRLAVLALSVALTVRALASPASAAVIMNLGDFEDHTLGAWQQTQWSAGGTGAWQANDSDVSWMNGLPVGQAVGNYQAVADHDLPYVTAVLYRDFTVPMNADSLKLVLWYIGYWAPGFVSDMPTLEPGGQGQGVRIDVMSPAQPVLGMAGIIATPFATSYPGNAADYLAPTTIRMSVVSLRGQTVRLRIAAMANTSWMVTGIDDVRLEGAQYVEVATSLPQLRDGAVDWGDCDNDGDLDLAIMGNNGSTRVASIWRNDAGTFSKLLDLPEGLDAGDIKWVDLDRDGDLDIVAIGTMTASPFRRNRFGLNLGGGSFTWGSTTNGVAQSNLALADYDNDGDLDLAAAWTGLTEVLRNTGAGGISEILPSGATLVDSAFTCWDRMEFPGFFVTGRYLSGGSPTEYTHYGNSNGSGSFQKGTTARGLVAAAYEIADANGDGVEDWFYSGRNPQGLNLYQGVQRDDLPGTVIPDDIPALYAPFARWMDDDADGDMDLVVGGLNEAGRYTRIHRWSANSLSASGDAFPQLSRAACAWGDYDGDGDPDLLLMGESSTGPVTRLYANTLATPNLAPSAPTSTSTTFTTPTLVISLGITLQCAGATDDHTPSGGLTYGFRAGTTPGGTDLVATEADLATGRRRVAREGGAANRPYHTILWGTLYGLHSNIYFSAQAIDGARRGGPWTAERAVSFAAPIASVTDIPGDQGGSVRLRITAGPFDRGTAQLPVVASQTIWRRIDNVALATSIDRAAAGVRAEPGEGATAELPTVEMGGRRFVAASSASAAGFPAGTWEVVGNVPAMQWPEYYASVPTVADSGATGAHWSVFVVTSHLSSPTTWWVSPADSGKSVDNIVPGVPQGLVAQYHTGGGNALAWQPSADTDFQYFRVYRGDTPGFAMGAGTLAANVAGTQWSDPAFDAPGVYYRVTAVDHNGNESAAASPGQVTDVADAPGPAFALAAPSPSPFAGSTRIAFALPRASHVSLEVYDAGGRRLRTLANGPMAAGVHEVAWDGSGEAGARAAAGILFVRLRADGREAVRRVVALRGAK